MYNGKRIKVILVGDAKEEYEKLNEIVGEERLKDVSSSDHQTLLKAIKQKIEFLRVNPEYGKHISKNKMPKDYIQDYDVNNLWKVNLSGAWRMIYTLKGTEVEILTIILDLMNHKDYERKFGYRKC